MRLPPIVCAPNWCFLGAHLGQLRTARNKSVSVDDDSRWTYFRSFEISLELTGSGVQRRRAVSHAFAAVRAARNTCRCRRLGDSRSTCPRCHGGDRRGRHQRVAVPAGERHDRRRRHRPLGVRPGGDHAHVTSASSSNWTLDETRDPNGAAGHRRRSTPPASTRSCARSTAAMTGSVTVAGRRADARARSSSSRGRSASATTRSRPGITMLQELGAANGFTVTATEDPTQFTDANLAQFDVVVFLSTTSDVLNDAQQTAFEHYIEAGGGYVGIHAATDTEYQWAWYGQMLGGYFRNHPAGTPTATVNIEDTNEPSTTGITTPWTRVDEWYNFQPPTNPVVNGGGNDYSPRDSGVKVLDDGRRVDLRRGRRQHHRRRPPGHVVHRLRRRPRLVHGARPHAGLLLRGAVPRRWSSAASRPPRAPSPPTAAPRARPPRRPTTSRSPRSTTTPRARWSSPSPRTAASSTSSASPARST